jgi:alkylated DNA repair dioxygenase AlkB
MMHRGSLRDIGGPDILYLPGILSLDANQRLFDTLRSTVVWDESMKARKTASYGVPYDFNQMSYETTVMPSWLEELCSAVEKELNFRPNNCLLNYYKNGNSYIGFHSDSAVNLAPETGVAVLSLGSPRTMVFRNKADRALQHNLILQPGSLLYMSNEMQLEWLHGIPKESNPEDGAIGERISITLRKIDSPNVLPVEV